MTDFTNIKDICDSEGISYLDIFDYEGWVEVEAAMDSFIREEIEPSMSDYEKIKRPHDFICRKITYGKESSTGDCRHRYQYCAPIEGHGVCIDYAMTLGYLTARMGYETYSVHGYGSKALGNHAWNIIRLGDNYYHVDCTWDDKTPTCYKYFLISDSTIRSYRDYKWDTDDLPRCDSDYMGA